ncbi:DUF4129 domain-containing protein [Nocardioides sp.]|uniref:DUF4129 domain-containing protein n=1 Tax=Nocardioides sp. TaxID=35761 RepID=UPI002CBFEFCA|nr:DUF4129 domain-containing protein [Nocardioides sp.]HXH80492.1 DUF4129 domain-containing protein [Nocardioides sp.]
MTSGAWRAAAATAVTCVLVTMVGWAALIGPSEVFTGPGPQPSSETTTTSEAPVEDVKELQRKDIEEREYGAATIIIANVIGGAIQLFVLVGMGWVAYLLLRRARRAWQLRRHFEAPATADFDILEAGHPERVRRMMADDAEAQLALLLDGEARNAIVACWHRFEVQAHHAGLPRRPWETSSEFALRMLELAEVDSPAVSRLLALYREARFSEHPMAEDDRRAAAEALRQIQSSIAASSSPGRSG